MKLRNSLIAMGVTASIMSAVVSADDYTMIVDKQTWTPGIQAMTDTAGAGSNAKMKVESMIPSDKYTAFIKASIAGGNAPAFYNWWNGGQLIELVGTGAVADLSEYWDAAIANGDFSEGQKELVSVDGKPYALLLNVANWVTFYNMEAFEKAGVDGTPETWDELMDAAEKLKAAGYTPFNAPVAGSWMPFIWFSQLVAGVNPDSFVGLTDGSVAYDSPDVQEAFRIWGEMYDKGYFTDPREQNDQNYFVDGTAAMYLIGDWHTGSFVKAGMVPGKHLGAFLMPPVNDDTELFVIVEAAPVVVSKKALEGNAELSKVVEGMFSAAASNSLGDVAGVYNGNLNANTPNAIIESNKLLLIEKQPRTLVRWWEAVPPQIQGALVAAMGEFMFNPTPKQAQASMNEMQQINADYWENE